MQVAFWPVSVKGDLCGNRTTVYPNVTTPQVASIWGTTVTSPTLIVSFGSIYAYDNCNNAVGSTLSDYLLLQQPSQISSQCGLYHNGYGPGTQVNFADFEQPYPASAYMCMPECGGEGGGQVDHCSTMYDYLRPNIAFPTDLGKLIPQWASCSASNYFDSVYDPPIALQPVRLYVVQYSQDPS